MKPIHVTDYLTTILDEIAAEPNPANRAMLLRAFDAESKNQVARALRQAAWRFRQQGLSSAEVANLFGISRRTVEWRVRRHCDDNKLPWPVPILQNREDLSGAVTPTE